ncbi:MAG: hypothetical protein AB1631_02440, partial [Acidobacteriota bacterium]
MSADNEEKGFDRFELLAAMLLGLGAIGAAIAAFQGGLWDGKMIESFGDAQTTATKASTAYNEANVTSAHDAAVDIQAKKLILEGLDAGDGATRDRSFEMAGYLYAFQMSEEGYKAFGFPDQERTPEKAREVTQAGSMDVLPDEMLVAALEKELDEKYEDAIFAEGLKLFQDADKKFSEGRNANEVGDKFDLLTVIYAISLFFAGLGLVFKTRMRWSFLL